MDDGRIIELFWRRDEAAIEEARAKYGAYCFAVAKNVLSSPEDAEECVNDTLLRAWGAIPPQRPARLKLFLARIARNISFDRYKAQRAEKRGGGELPLVLEELRECAGSERIESELERKELEKAIAAFVHGLPEREKVLLLRRYFYTEPISKIASQLGLSEANAMSILSRTRKKLRTYLEKEGLINE